MIILFILLAGIELTAQAPQKSTNRHFSHQLETKIDPHKIWQVWIDVANWHEWDTGLAKAEMESPFAIGEKGIITSLEGRKSRFKIVDFQAGQSYTFRTKLLFSNLYVKRYLSHKDGKVFLTHEVWFKGLTAGLFARKFGPRFRNMLPQVMQNVVQKATAL